MLLLVACQGNKSNCRTHGNAIRIATLLRLNGPSRFFEGRGAQSPRLLSIVLSLQAARSLPFHLGFQTFARIGVPHHMCPIAKPERLRGLFLLLSQSGVAHPRRRLFHATPAIPWSALRRHHRKVCSGWYEISRPHGLPIFCNINAALSHRRCVPIPHSWKGRTLRPGGGAPGPRSTPTDATLPGFQESKADGELGGVYLTSMDQEFVR
jgi:hypothetical protein